MLLSELKTREKWTIVKIRGQGAFRKRITEMGFVRGQKVTVIKNAPLQDPVEYSVMGYEVSLRRAEASLIEVVTNSPEDVSDSYHGTQSYESVQLLPKKGEKTINIALTGNPNCGKTSIFNFASKSFEHVGNYGGVTVETKLARIEYQGYTFNLFDLPGTYSLSSYSPEEIFVRNFLNENQPDIIVNVVDSTNLERNLYLTTQLIDMNQKMVIALNMYDELRRKGDKFNHLKFSDLLGVPVIPTVGSRGKGLARLFEAIIKKFNQSDTERKRVHINYGPEIEQSVQQLLKKILNKENQKIIDRICPRYIALKLLEDDEHIMSVLNDSGNYEEIIAQTEKEKIRITDLYADDPDTIISESRYGFINGALKETYQVNTGLRRKTSEKIDNVLTHRIFGIPLFFAFLWLMFITTFKIGQYPMNWIESGVSGLSMLITENFASGDLRDLIVDGILGGVGGVLVFLPNILILFFFISMLEDTGYMARAAFIMDKVMHKIGLHGKSFIPLVMGFGCNVPAIMSTRIIESRSNRLLTMMILPFMSCSARLPIYILIIGVFFPHHQGTVLFGVYLTGIFLAVITALIFKKFFFRKSDSPFVMELPPYRVPTLKNVSRHMWQKALQYLEKIAGIILIASIIIWGLNYYPKSSKLFGENQTNESYLEIIGKKVEPVMKPVGMDWKMTVSILAGIPGKEIVVSTMGVLYGDKNQDQSQSLSENLQQERDKMLAETENPAKVTLSALAFLLFTLIYFPCIAVISTVARESGSIWWAVVMIIYTTSLAWLMSFLVYQGGLLLIN